MAEQVQASLDQMVAPLADLMDRKIFSQAEIHAIVARRRESEYLLRRRAPRKADFLKYIQEELQLEKLRQLRTKKQQAVERERLEKLGRLDEWQASAQKKNLGDPHMIQLIHQLFRRALRRYNREDVSVYLQYADVCKELKSYTKLPQVYAEAVQLHPQCSGLWIEAASHEFFHRQSVAAARILLQRALRINQRAKGLWLQSFALEFHHIAKLQGRRTVLEGGEKGEEADNSTTVPVDPTLFAVAKVVYAGAIEAIPDDVSFRLQFLDLCQNFPFTETMEDLIFKTIRRDFKDNPKAWIARAAHLLEQKTGDESKGFTIAPKEDNSDEDSKSEDDSDGSDSSDDDEVDEERPAKKRRKDMSSATTHKDPLLAIIQQAIQAVDSSDMYLESVKFLWLYWEKAEELFEENSEKMEATRQDILEFLQEVLGDVASNLEIYSVALALEHAEFYNRVDQEDRAHQVLVEFREAAVGKDNIRLTPIWLELAELTFQQQSAAGAHGVLEESLMHTPMSHPDHLQLLLHLLGVELDMENKAFEAGSFEATKLASPATFEKVLLLAAGKSANVGSEDDTHGSNHEAMKETSFGIKNVEQACWQFLLHMIDLFGPVSGARQCCKIVLYQSNFIDRQDSTTMEDVETLVAFFTKCLELEIDNLKKKEGAHQSKPEQKKSKLCVRQLFDAAIRLFKDIPSLAAKFQQERLDASLLY